jgi:hypothetical protein
MRIRLQLAAPLQYASSRSSPPNQAPTVFPHGCVLTVFTRLARPRQLSGWDPSNAGVSFSLFSSSRRTASEQRYCPC